MEAKTKKILWISAAILAVVLIILYFYNKAKKNTIATPDNNNSGNSYSAGNGNTTSQTSSAGTSIAYHGTDPSKWAVGNQIKAVAPVVNIYSVPSAAPSNLVKSYNAGDIIGPLLAVVTSPYAKVRYLDSTLGFATTSEGWIYITQVNTPSAANVTT